MSAHTKSRPRWSWRRSRLSNAFGQLIFSVLAALAYFGIRHLSRSDPDVAMRHASSIRSVERHLGIHVENRLQGYVVPHHALVTFFNDVYIYGHWPVIAAGLVWLLWRHPAEFVLARNAMIFSGMIALVVFALYPVAPPRLADPATVDTVTLYSNAYRILQPTALTNAYAAMPSLHCGWDLVVALSLARMTTRRLIKVATALLPALMVVAVIVTGNHYILDAVAGDALVLTGIALARSYARRQGSAVVPVDGLAAGRAIQARPVRHGRDGVTG